MGSSNTTTGKTVKTQWPKALVSCLRQHLSVGICDGVLSSCTRQGDFSPSDWKTSSRRKLLIEYLCKRAGVFMPEADVQMLREELELASYSTWRHSPSAEMPRPSLGGSERPAIRKTTQAPGDGPNSRGNKPNTLRLSVHVSEEADVLSARTKALSLAKQAGASLFVRTRIATLVSELARRIQQQGGGGRLDLRVVRDQLVVISSDQGPSIDDLEQVLQSPDRHRNGPFAAIVACQSLALQFSARSHPDLGTTITATLALR